MLTFLRYASWGGRLPHRPVEDLAFAVARFFQRGGSFQNYYMVQTVGSKMHGKVVLCQIQDKGFETKICFTSTSLVVSLCG